jgi:hypothetical protein
MFAKRVEMMGRWWDSSVFETTVASHETFLPRKEGDYFKLLTIVDFCVSLGRSNMSKRTWCLFEEGIELSWFSDSLGEAEYTNTTDSFRFNHCLQPPTVTLLFTAFPSPASLEEHLSRVVWRVISVKRSCKEVEARKKEHRMTTWVKCQEELVSPARVVYEGSVCSVCIIERRGLVLWVTSDFHWKEKLLQATECHQQNSHAKRGDSIGIQDHDPLTTSSRQHDIHSGHFLILQPRLPTSLFPFIPKENLIRIPSLNQQNHTHFFCNMRRLPKVDIELRDEILSKYDSKVLVVVTLLLLVNSIMD